MKKQLENLYLAYWQKMSRATITEQNKLTEWFRDESKKIIKSAN